MSFSARHIINCICGDSGTAWDDLGKSSSKERKRRLLKKKRLQVEAAP